MTVPEFLANTDMTRQQIADHCGVDISRVFDWANGSHVPEGPPLLKLVELSKYRIKADDLPRKNRGGHFRSEANKKRSSRRG